MVSVKDSAQNTMDSVRLRHSSCFDGSARNATNDLRIQQTNRSQKYGSGLSTTISKHGAMQAQYRRSVHMRQVQDIRENLEGSLKTFQKSQKLRKFIDDSNGPLECREGSIGHRKGQLPAAVGQNARIKKLKNMDVGATLTRRGSCFAM